MENSTAKITGANTSLRLSSNQDFLDGRAGQYSKGYLELEGMNLEVDERTGRIAPTTPDSVADTVKDKKAD